MRLISVCLALFVLALPAWAQSERENEQLRPEPPVCKLPESGANSVGPRF